MKRFIASLAILEFLLVMVHLAVYEVISTVFNIPPGPVDNLLKTVFVILAFTFVSASALARRYHNRLIAAYYTFSAYWFGLINFLFIGALVFFIVESVFLYAAGIYVEPFLLGAIAFGGAFLTHFYATLKSNRTEITKIPVSIPNLPEAWKGRRIVFATDLHLGNIRSARFAKRIAHLVSSLAPYAFWIGGDLYDGPACDEAAAIEPLRHLAKELAGGIWFITGNHEYYLAHPDDALHAVKDAGIRILDNEVAEVDGVQLVGLDDRDTHDRKGAEATFAKLALDKSKPAIMLKHIPVDLDIAEKTGIHLGLFGHTHRGQIYPLSLFTRLIYKGYDYGFKEYGGMKTYTSSGAGTWGPPLRLGSKSEIVLLEFR